MATSYSNSAGSGDRTYLILVKSDLTYGGGYPGQFISNISSSLFFTNGQAVSAKSITFDFGTAKVIDEATWSQDNATTHGTWKWQGSNDDSSYTDIGSSFTLGGTAQVQTSLNGNATAYRYYKLLGVSGNTSSSPFLNGIIFKIGALDTNVGDYGNIYGVGDRTASIVISESQTTGSNNLLQNGGGSLNHLLFVDNLNLHGLGVNCIFFISSVAVLNKWILIQFPSAVIVSEIRWFQDALTTHGVWQLQGSNDGSSFTSIGATFTLGSGYDTTIGYSKITTISANATAYIYYRFLGVSGNASSAPFLYELGFKVAATQALGLSSSDTINLLSDATTNSGFARAANAQFDGFNFRDSIQIFGGDPFYKVQFGDSLLSLLQDSLRTPIPAIVKSFTDTINLLADVYAGFLGIPIRAFDSQQFNWAEAVAISIIGPITQAKSDTINNLVDIASVTRGNVLIRLTLTDTINLLADARRFFDIVTVIAEDNYVLSDATRLRFTHLLRVAEILTSFLDAQGIAVGRRPAFSDSFSLSDAAVVRLSVLRTISKGDTLSLTDAVSIATSGNYNGSGAIQRIRRYLNDIN